MDIGIGIGIAVVFLAVVVSWDRPRARPVDVGPAKVKHQRVEIDDQMVTDMVTNGVPGSMSDANVLAAIRRIENAPLANEVKYEMLDALYFMTINNHASGMAADVINDISRATDKVLRCKEGE